MKVEGKQRVLRSRLLLPVETPAKRPGRSIAIGHRLLLVLLVSFLAPAVGMASPGPCEGAASLVGETLRKAPERMGGWPLYEAELKLDVAKGVLEGRLRITVEVVSGARLRVVLPVEGGTSASPFEWREVTIARGASPPIPVKPRLEGGLLLFPKIPAGEGPVILKMRIHANLPRQGPPAMGDALRALAPGPAALDLGFLAVHEVGVTLITAYPVLLDPAASFPSAAPAAYGAHLPSPAACHLVSVEVPRSHEVRATGQQVGRIPGGEGKVRYTFVAGGARRFSLLALPTGRPSAETKVQGVRLRASAESREMARRFLKWGREALASLEAEWGPYPYGRLEIASVPLSGALDGGHGPGLVLVSTVFEGEGDLFALGALSSSPGGAAGADLQELTVVHQIAHQWIGEGVATPGPVSPVLEEMIASYGLLRHAARRHGAASARALGDKVMGQLYQTWRALGSDDAPADRPIAALTLGGWVGLGLGKASLLLPRLERSVGARSVRKAVRAWLSAGRFGIQDRTSLQAALLAAVAVAKRPAVLASLRRGLDEAHGDETIGAGDLDAIFGAGALPPGMMPGGGSFGALDDPAVQQLMQEMLRALQGGGP